MWGSGDTASHLLKISALQISALTPWERYGDISVEKELQNQQMYSSLMYRLNTLMKLTIYANSQGARRSRVAYVRVVRLGVRWTRAAGARRG
jgi:hypothetical protein